MLPTHDALRRSIREVVDDRQAQGHIVDGLYEQLDALPDSYDELTEFAGRLDDLPLRPDWPYVEPDDLNAIRAECEAFDEAPTVVDIEHARRRVGDAFIARVCGCMLGKPFEIDVTHEQIRAALESAGDWPLSGYPPERAIRALPTLHPQWEELVDGRIDHVAVDDDINYTILAMLALEEHGATFTHTDLRRLWLRNLPVAATFGPERTTLLSMGMSTLESGSLDGRHGFRDPGAEFCGALIRADAYGYACPGRPALAAALAYRDATLTHRRTGVYGAMFVAAAVALAFCETEPVDLFSKARRFVPPRSRFGEAVDTCLAEIAGAGDWIEGFERIRVRYGEFGFCRIYQEIGTVMNSVHFARDPGEGICIQVMQGNDTDSFAATAGSILGVLHGPIGDRWTDPLRDHVQTALAMFHESSLQRIAERMSDLPDRLREA